MDYRIEKDLLGEEYIPVDAYWGIQTLRAIRNFPISGIPVNPGLIKALAMVKKACCLANSELKFLSQEKARAISRACDEIFEGGLDTQFPVDALQGGAGTSVNMNINEVIANRALEISGLRKGEYQLIHPIEHVNLHQSTNDVFPTAVKIACILRLRDLSGCLASLQGAFQRKEKEFSRIVTIGRTELQDAVPITLGAEFGAFAEAIARDRWRTFKCEERLRVVNIGGTAVGTGLTAPRSYIFLVIEKLREISGLGLSRSENVLDATANMDCFVETSGILKAHAASALKIANDLRVLNLFGEINFSPLQPGSSIMPGKINPVMAEAVMQAALKVMANDFLVSEACSRSTFQINEFMPLLAHAMMESLDLLVNVTPLFEKNVNLIGGDEQVCRSHCDTSMALMTALVPVIGYAKTEELVKEFMLLKETDVRGFLIRKIGEKRVDEIFSPFNLTSLGYRSDDEENT
ncbi:MAG: aspartate ammonia-lyase [Candidatus Omnitrophica bacterium]|nr:aspartate ammonia-lyase [Candidatus Omnitrophota bacterium]